MQAFKKNVCSSLRVLWLQRLDLWDDLEGLAAALGPAFCPVLSELFLDLALDTQDVQRLAMCLHNFPQSLKTLGVVAVAIKNRSSEGGYEDADPTPALAALARALMQHPRPGLQCLDISLHYEQTYDEAIESEVEGQGSGRFMARKAAMPIVDLLGSGVLTGLKHIQLSSCCLDDDGLVKVC
ncbi:unnamed protein product, partial [Discosporangium mesarthrocarpum]